MSYKPEYILIFGAQFNLYIIIEKKRKRDWWNLYLDDTVSVYITLFETKPHKQ